MAQDENLQIGGDPDSSELLESTISKPLKEKLLPKTSIRFFLALTAVCAAGMVLFRAASDRQAFWTKILSLLIMTTIGCFVVYLILFLVANLFSATTTPIAAALKEQSVGDTAHIGNSAGESK